jgi:hypothetical protein
MAKGLTVLIILLLSSFLSLPTELDANPLNQAQEISVILLSPENKTYTSENLRLTFRVSHWQTANVDTWLTIDNQMPVKLYLGNYLGSIGEGEYDSSITGLTEGSHFIKIRSSSGNDYNEGIVYFSIDNTAPTISSVSIENKTYTTKDLELNCAINESTSWIGYSLDKQANETIKITPWLTHKLGKEVSSSMHGNITLPALSEGSHSLVIYANDTAGNMGNSQMIVFTVDGTEALPFATIMVAVFSVTIVICIGIVLLLLRRHRKNAILMQ